MVVPSGGDARDEAPRAAPTASDAVPIVSDVSAPIVSAPIASAPDVCRYLLAPAVGVRYAHPDREHRCLAVRPYGPIAHDRQRHLCLTADHETCPAFEAARERRLAMLAESGIQLAVMESGRSRPIERTAPLVLEAGRASLGRSRVVAPASDAPGWSRPDVPSAAAGVEGRRIVGPTGRRGAIDDRWRALAGPGLAVIVVIAALAVAAARLPGPARPAGAGTSQRTASSVPATSARATSTTPPSATSALSTLGPTAAVTPVATPAATSIATSGASTSSSAPGPTRAASQTAQGARTYLVKPGDTLSAIAVRFGVSVAAIEELNGIKDPRLLQAGQVLRIP